MRYGEENPVYLFKLKEIASQRFASIEPHVCKEDYYNAELFSEDRSLNLTGK